METGGPHDEEGRAAGDPPESAAAPPDNVVLFPRDWFGPTEELVPFGSRAAGTGVVDPERPGGLQPTSHVADPPAPLRAEDFWSEGSAAIHHVLQAPAADEVVVEPGEEENPFAAGFTAGALALLAAFRAAALTSPIRRVPLPARARFLVSATLLAVAGAGIVLPRSGSGTHMSMQSPPGAHAVVLDASASGLTSTLAGPKASSFRLASRRAERSQTHANAVRSHVSARRRASPTTGMPSMTSASYSEPVQGIPVSTESESTAGGAGSGGGGSGASPSTSTPTAVASSAGSSSQGGNPAPTGPKGPGAPFGPGRLG